jgi:hypothetical protein
MRSPNKKSRSGMERHILQAVGVCRIVNIGYFLLLVGFS